jgi:hypothetical protein
MKKAVLLAVSGAALFAAGYFIRYTTHPAAEPEKKPGPVAAAAIPRSATAAATAAEKANTAEGVRKFMAGRPFPKGGAKAWLLQLAMTLNGDDEAMIPELLDVVQTVMTMDEESAKEMADALVEFALMIENEDPALKALPANAKADDLVEGGLMLAMIRLSQFNPEAVLAMMQKHPGMGDDDMVQMLVFGRLASKDPQRAEQLALSLPEDSREGALESILKSMAAKDPRAALAFAQKYPEDLSNSDMGQVLQNWAKREPQQAVAEAVRLTGESGNSEMVTAAFAEWLRKDAPSAGAWAATHEGAGKTAVQALLLEERAKKDPSSVLTEYAALQQSATDPDELTGLSRTIAGQLAEKDITATRSWVESLPPGAPRDAATQQLAEQWINEDAEAASAWIKELPPGDARDAAARELSDKIMRRDPAAALEWARSIQDEGLRKDRMDRILGSWEEQDPEAAKAARAALPPPADPTEFDPPQIPQTFGPGLKPPP